MEMSNNENLKEAYNAIVDYHNNIIQNRFVVAGLFLAANGFLAGGYLQTHEPLYQITLITLSLILTFICYMLEVRNRQLADNLWDRGRKLEMSLGLNEDQGFFALLEKQPIGPKYYKGQVRKTEASKKEQKIVSHTNMIFTLYLAVCIFWLIMLGSLFVNWLIVLGKYLVGIVI